MNISDNSSLEQARITLLEWIQAEESVHTQTLFKGRYNLIVEQKIAHNRGLYPDPIEIFSPEIWIRLLQHWIASDDGRSVEEVLKLTLVSKRWRNAILVCPELWSEIAIGPGLAQPDLLVMVETCLYLSQKYPLTLVIEHPTREWDLVEPVLRPHAYRIRRISIRQLTTKEPGIVDPDKPSAAQILHSLGHLPQLAELDLYRPKSRSPSEFYGLPAFLSQVPSLKSITGEWMPHSILSHETIGTIQDIAIDDYNGTLLPWVSHHKHLRSLHYITGPAAARSTSPREASLSISETNFESLWFHSDIDIGVIHLLRYSPRVTQLKIVVSWKTIAEFVKMIGFLEVLDYLSIEVTGQDPQPNKFEPPNILSETRVKTLRVRHEYNAQDEEAILLEKSNRRRLYQIFKDCLPAVEEFVLVSDDDFDIPHIYLSSLTRLVSLRLRLSKLSSVDIPFLNLPSVALLELQMPLEMVLEFLPKFKCDRLVELEVVEPGSIDFISPPNIVLELDPVVFRNLKGLRWRLDMLRWNPTSLSSLTIINFGEPSRVTASDFCVYLAKRPHDCPALEKIDFRDWPEWDLLLIMLERRNFLRDSAISPIKFVTFPSTFGPFLRHPLADLLRGRFTQRPPNEEISIVSIHWDPSVCYHCWRARHQCNSDRIEAYTAKYTTRRQCSEYVESLSPSLPLSPELEGWFKQRQDRYDKLYELEKSWNVEARINACSKHELGWKYKTTGFTFCGSGAEYSASLNPYSLLPMWSNLY